jgi:hypothetical protein
MFETKFVEKNETHVLGPIHFISKCYIFEMIKQRDAVHTFFKLHIEPSTMASSTQLQIDKYT